MHAPCERSERCEGSPPWAEPARAAVAAEDVTTSPGTVAPSTAGRIVGAAERCRALLLSLLSLLSHLPAPLPRRGGPPFMPDVVPRYAPSSARRTRKITHTADRRNTQRKLNHLAYVCFGSRAVIRQGCWHQFRQHARQRRAGCQQRAAEARGGGAGAATAPTMACPPAWTATCSTRTVWQWCSPLPWHRARASPTSTIVRQRFAPRRRSLSSTAASCSGRNAR